MVSRSMLEGARKVAEKLETFGYKSCEPPADFPKAIGDLWMFMESPEGRVTRVKMDCAVDWKTGSVVDLNTGKLGPAPKMQPPGGCMPKP